LCTLGDPLADLGQLIMYWAEPGEVSQPEHSATTVGGFPTRKALVAAYANRSGRDISAIDFYVAFAYWKLACICAGVYTRYVAGAQGDDDTNYEAYPERIGYLSHQALSIACGLPGTQS
jgi:aminoglycoside phosphotransferase (APT) family kinase protein